MKPDKNLIISYNVDQNGDKMSVKIDNENIRVNNIHYSVQLSQVPDEKNRVVVIDDKGEELVEVYNLEDITNSQFYYVDYVNGIVYFHHSMAGKTCIFNFYGKGLQLLGASRVYDEKSLDGKSIIKTLQDIIDKGRECIEALSTIGDAIELLRRIENYIIEATKLDIKLREDIRIGDILHLNLTNDISTGTTLHNNLTNDITVGTKLKNDLDNNIATGTTLNTNLKASITEGNTTKTKLDQSIAEAQDDIATIQSTGNGTWTIPSSAWTGTAPDLTYNLKHNMNSKNLVVSVVDTTTQKSVLPDYRIVDMNNIEIQSTKAMSITVTINAKYYSGKDANIIASEVIDARGGEVDLNSRLDKYGLQLADITPLSSSGTDDTLKLQEMINKGGVITLSKKNETFRVTGKIIVPSNTYIEGNGCTILADIPIVFESVTPGTKNITIKNVKLIGNNSIPVVNTDGAINIKNAINVNIIDNDIQKFHNGVSIMNSMSVRVKYNHIYEYHTYGVMLSRTSRFFCDENEIHDTIVTGQTQGVYCISCTGASDLNDSQKYCSITNNKLYNNEPWSAIMSHDVSNLIISNNQIDNVRNGIDLSTEHEVRGIIISNNIMNGTLIDSWNGANAANDGILLYTGNGASNVICIFDITITGNHIEGFGIHNTGSQACGEIFLGGIKGCNISGNTIIHNDGIPTYSAGIFASYNVSDLSLSDNYIKTQNKNGIRFKNTDGENININGNTIRCATNTVNAIEISDCTFNNFNVDNNITNAIGYYERGTNIINGVSLSAPYGGRGISKKLSCRINVGQITVASKSKVILVTQTLTGATVGDTVNVGYAGTKPGLIVYGYVSSSNTVTVEAYNTNDLEVTSTSNTLTINVIKNF